MKVLLLHNFYQSSSPSGEDAVYRNEAELLKSRGIAVIPYERQNDEISGPLSKLKATFDAIWSRKTYQEVSALIKKERPDIAHFHNIWYLISPSAYYACRDAGVPVVQTLHNFRIFCANGLLLRGGRVCEECVGRSPWRGAAYGCFRNSRLYSTPVVFAEMIHQMKETWVHGVDAYIALTEFGKQKFIECGLPKEKMFVKPNFLPHQQSRSEIVQDYAVFIGRLSEEKGVDMLLKALGHLKPDLLRSWCVKIIGDGPLKQTLQAEAQTQGLERTVEFLGKRSHADCMELLGKARFLILPALCYENFPMTIVEAFACGKPVVTSNHGAMASIVEHEITGLLFETGECLKLAEALSMMISDTDLCTRMGIQARREFEQRFTAEHNFDQLMTIYSHVLQNRT